MKNILIVLVLLLITYSIVSVLKSPTAPQEKSTENNSVTEETDDAILTKNKIDLSGKNLTQTPMYIFDETNTEELNLSNNKLTGSLPSQIGNLKKLKILDLSNNNFTGVPAEIGHINSLEVLNLSNNNLTGLPNELGELSNLKLLDLSGNNYSEQDLEEIRTRLPNSVIIKI